MREIVSAIQRFAGSRTGLAMLTVLCVSAGVAAGLGGYTFLYAKGASYMTNAPEACANCHVMQPYLDAWVKGSHRSVAVCNDCHTPHNFFGKYYTKARNGYHHSYAFTTGDFHEPIQITDVNRRITEDACRYCHADIVSMMCAGRNDQEHVSCISCHATVGHAQ